MRLASRFVLTLALTAALAVPAQAATPTATTASPSVQTAPVQPSGSAFGPLQGLGTGATTSPEQTITTAKSTQKSSGRGTLLILSLAALVMIAGVGVFIWYEGARKKTTEERRRRQRMRSGRPGATAAAMSAGSRSGPPPPPRKRGRSAAKRKKR